MIYPQGSGPPHRHPPALCARAMATSTGPLDRALTRAIRQLSTARVHAQDLGARLPSADSAEGLRTARRALQLVASILRGFSRRGHAMKPVPRGLLEHIQQVAPPGAEVVPLEWGFDGEDNNLAVFVDEGEDWRAMEGRLLDA